MLPLAFCVLNRNPLYIFINIYIYIFIYTGECALQSEFTYYLMPTRYDSQALSNWTLLFFYFPFFLCYTPCQEDKGGLHSIIQPQSKQKILSHSPLLERLNLAILLPPAVLTAPLHLICHMLLIMPHNSLPAVSWKSYT